MLKLAWSETALDDLDAILDYIGSRNLPAAIKLRIEIETRAEQLLDHPYMYRRGQVDGTREAVVHPNYLLVYKIGSDSIEIVNVMHTRRQYPPANDA